MLSSFTKALSQYTFFSMVDASSGDQAGNFVRGKA
jgi:hypothetical protein